MYSTMYICVVTLRQDIHVVVNSALLCMCIHHVEYLSCKVPVYVGLQATNNTKLNVCGNAVCTCGNILYGVCA